MTSESDTAEDGASDREQTDAGRTGVFVATSPAERQDAFAVRRAVFVDEQGVDEEIEWDEHDEPHAAATHFVAYDDGEPIGAARFRVPSVDTDSTGVNAAETTAPTGKVERVAVAADRRGEGWGVRLMDAVEERAREDGFGHLTLHAQTRVRDFYERLGYIAHGDVFYEAGIPHVSMTKPLDGGTSASTRE